MAPAYDVAEITALARRNGGLVFGVAGGRRRTAGSSPVNHGSKPTCFRSNQYVPDTWRGLRHRLTAFEFALREADIEQQNLVSVSSIFPPRCQLIAREDGVATLRPGEVTFSVMARAETNEPGRLVHASIGLARPADPAMYGYISEHHGFGMSAQESGDYAEDLAATMLASTLGIDFDPDAAWNERKRVTSTTNSSSTACR